MPPFSAAKSEFQRDNGMRRLLSGRRSSSFLGVRGGFAAGSRTAAARRPYPRGTWGASRHGAAAPFVSIGRGAAPSGPHFHCGLPSRSREAHKLEPDFFMRMGHGRLGPRGDRSPCSQPAHWNQNTAEHSNRQCPTRRAYGSERRAVSPS